MTPLKLTNVLGTLRENKLIVSIWSIFLALTTPAIYELYHNKLGFLDAAYWIGIVTAVSVVTTILIYSLKTRQSVSLYESQNRIESSKFDIEKYVESSKIVDLLGGTFKSFTDKRSNLESLAKKINNGGEIRILMLHPDGDGIRLNAEARQERGAITSVDDLRLEILSSIKRIVEMLGETNAKKYVRLYQHSSTFSVYRFDDYRIITLYTYGRGASSPAIVVDKSASTASFIRSIDRGFNELWSASSTSALEDSFINQLKNNIHVKLEPSEA